MVSTSCKYHEVKANFKLTNENTVGLVTDMCEIYGKLCKLAITKPETLLSFFSQGI